MAIADEVTLPSYWASALVNGDFSGLTVEESIRCRAAIERLAKDGWTIAADVEDSERFTRHYDLYDPLADCSAGNVCDYIILK